MTTRAINCLVCPTARRRKSEDEWRASCGVCRDLSEFELSDLIWIQNGSADRTVVPPIMLRASRQNSLRRYEALRAVLAAPAGVRVLEIGCNHHPTGDLFRDTHYFGIDLRHDFVARAKALQPTSHLSVQSAAALAFPTGAFDVAIMLDVIEHVPLAEVPTVCAEVARVLAPGGKLYLSTPDGEPTAFKAVLGGRTERSHVVEFSAPQVEAMWRAAGLRLLSRHPIEGLLLPDYRITYALRLLLAEHEQVSRAVEQLTRRMGYRNWLYVLEKPRVEPVAGRETSE